MDLLAKKHTQVRAQMRQERGHEEKEEFRAVEQGNLSKSPQKSAN